MSDTNRPNASTPGEHSSLDNLELRPLPGSERAPAPGVEARGAEVSADSRVEATLILRRRTEVPDDALDTYRSSAEFAATYGADPADVATVERTLTGLGVQVIESDPASRRIRISGTASLLGRIFGTELQTVRSGSGPNRVTHRQRTGPLSVPVQLEGIVTAVLGLDDRPQSRAQFRIAPAAAVSTSFTPVELGTIYRFPDGTDGSGQTIAIIELGGGFGQADLDAYFGGLGLTTPKVTAVGVDGGSNQPGQDPNGADAEVLLDIEVAGALAPGANFVVYFAPNTDAGFLDALSQASHASPAPIAISISWGQSEDQWTGQARTAFDQALVDAAALGVTVTVAAGDDGSTDRQSDGRSHVDFPASSPHALACGGTRLQASASSGSVTSETVWNNGVGRGATGGGVSTTFALPAWQQNIGVPSPSGHTGRGVPDVSAVADPQTGYRVRVDGTDTVIGGTSAVSPLWAALIARLAQAGGRRFGLIQPALYSGISAGSVAAGFRDITQGDNGAYRAGTGWDACTGLGVPDGSALVTALDTAPGAAAGRANPG